MNECLPLWTPLPLQHTNTNTNFQKRFFWQTTSGSLPARMCQNICVGLLLRGARADFSKIQTTTSRRNSSNVTFAYCTKGCINVAVLRGRPLTHVDAKPKWRPFIFISRESKWGTLQSAVPAEIYSICTDRRDLGPSAGLQVSPTSDTCQSVAILMNRPHSFIALFLSFFFTKTRRVGA